MTRPKLTAMPHLEARKQAEAEARAAARGQRTVAYCAICGTYPASFGFGVFIDDRPGALWSCMDRECRAKAETRAYPKSETGRAA